jgi:ParB family transcriptional regulator, chromosome partitioning protein
MKRSALGKGIAAIIANEPGPENKLQDIDIDAIYPSPDQPRKTFSPESLQQLADSIRESGLIQPVVVVKREGRFFLMVGERRWRAVRLLKWKKIPAIVRETPDVERMAVALIENIHREDLNPIEKASGIEYFISQSGMSQQQAGDKLGMSRVAVTNFLRLLNLPQKLKDQVVSGELDQGHARALLGLQGAEDMLTAADTVIHKQLSVRQTEALVKGFYQQKKKAESRPDPDITKTEDRLNRHLMTRTRLHWKKNGTGRIEVFFNSLEEFERILAMLIKG